MRWILVIDPSTKDLDDLKKLYPLAISSRDFYLEQLRIGLDRLKEKTLQYNLLGDFELLKICLEGFAGYFKIHPSLLGAEVSLAADIVLNDIIAKKNIEILTDNFLSNLVIESSSYYYLNLSNQLKRE